MRKTPPKTQKRRAGTPPKSVYTPFWASRVAFGPRRRHVDVSRAINYLKGGMSTHLGFFWFAPRASGREPSAGFFFLLAAPPHPIAGCPRFDHGYSRGVEVSFGVHRRLSNARSSRSTRRETVPPQVLDTRSMPSTRREIISEHSTHLGALDTRSSRSARREIILK